MGEKESLLYFRCLQLEGGGWPTSIQRSTPFTPYSPSPGQAGSETFYRQSQTGQAPYRNSTVSSDSLQIGHQWSDQCHLDCFKYSCFSSRVHLFPFLWGWFSELWRLMSWIQSGHRVVNFFHLGFPYLWDSSQDKAQKLSIIFEKELKVLDCA